MKKNKKTLLSLLLTFVLVSQFLVIPVKADDKANKEGTTNIVDVDAKSALLIEPSSGKVIFEKNSNEKFAPASVTKIMTMLLAMEAIDSGKLKLDDKIVCSAKVKSMGGSSMILDEGEIRTVEEILKGIAIASGNDAAVAMAEHIGGTEEAFVEMMNKKAQELGMKDTTFKNCTGLSADGHLTTANDIAIMSMELLKHPTILKYSSIYMETISEGRKTPIELVNHNKLVRFYEGCDGLKTGFTEEAKYCISATAVRNNVRMLAIIMGSPTYKIRNADASKLMNYGFSRFESKDAVTKDEEIEKVPLNKKGDNFFIAKAKDGLKVTMEKNSEEEIVKKTTIDTTRKHYKEGDIVGYCEVYVGDKLLGKVELYSDREAKQSEFFKNIKNSLCELFDRAV
ncbi:MAG: D-alanyl-D-alanine carboxypeptidase [Clostridium argentinense]|uniref:serine-type D-Ala-D-Ala carboxypeptidase n=1 Tax=Clostridium faecium TaxID=2762223 RepID=A0ABR8YWB0_9CLOT|nr:MULTISPECIES: D-alanyl-D-alanine carboxypeptidase family protein [Clostridium]MBD8048417.1 D-alanyl-D-alanine carboxypeptidase [Clostridium faecium]MBS5824084.1 D-alanyl-D-alanine carboxypeptidase [Clostridium argentinense]MDU1350914.1 D-alanyl-D-alanine carboxypeptidase family protein [Clostridium argentinense]